MLHRRWPTQHSPWVWHVHPLSLQVPLRKYTWHSSQCNIQSIFATTETTAQPWTRMRKTSSSCNILTHLQHPSAWQQPRYVHVSFSIYWTLLPISGSKKRPSTYSALSVHVTRPSLSYLAMLMYAVILPDLRRRMASTVHFRKHGIWSEVAGRLQY